MGDRLGEGCAYGNLGNAFESLGDFKRAIEYHQNRLSIAKQVGDRAGEGRAYGNLGIAYRSLGVFQQAIEYHHKHLTIAEEVGDRAEEGAAYGNLGNAFDSLGDFKQTIEYHQKHLSIAKEVGDRVGEGGAYGNLGNAYQSLGNFQKAIECHRKHLSVAKEVGNKAGEGISYGNLGNAYQALGDFKQAIEYYEKDLNIAKEVGDRAGEGSAYGNLGTAYQSLGDVQQAIEYQQKHLSIAKEVGDRAGEGAAYGNLGKAYDSLGDIQQAIRYYKKDLNIAKEVGDNTGEGMSCYNLGSVFESLGSLHKAIDFYRSSVKAFNITRALLLSEDVWKITFRDLHQLAYTALWRTLLNLKDTDEALCAAEEGRAQALNDGLKVKYGMRVLSFVSLEAKETISYVSREVSVQTVFLALQQNTVNIWLLSKENKVVFRQLEIQGGCALDDSVIILLETALKNIGAGVCARCENRSFDELSSDPPYTREANEEITGSSHCTNNSLKALYDQLIGPIADMLQDDELIIVPDGPLCLAPWSAMNNSIRIRTVPSLTSLRLIVSSLEDYHSRSGTLLVGDPCLKEVPINLPQLPCAKKEVEMIGEILMTQPLTGNQATKSEVLKGMTSVSLIHIAAHGRKQTGEIALAPNPGWSSKFPEEQDYILKMSDVQALGLRAKLVVLSCCHSGRGELKSEGVVGMARAFLCAGVRSVLASLWAIDDEATMEFMKIFYQHLREGKRASVALHQAMKYLRGSEKFFAMKYWAPFVLIGDDVTLQFDEETKPL